MNLIYKPFQPILTDAGLHSFGLTLKQATPSKELKGIVHSYLEITTDKATPYPIMPDGTQGLFISESGAVISGSLTKAHDFQILQSGTYFGIWFYPSALRYFIDLDLSELTNQFVSNEFIPWKGFSRLHEKLYENITFHQRSILFEEWLLKQYENKVITAFDHALSLIYTNHGNIKINDLSTIIGWSRRHLNRQFSRHIGLSTKSFSQIIRIQNACQQLHQPSRNTLKTAFCLGFFDQAHLLKDYKNKFLLSPNKLNNRFMSDSYNN